ncbi:hypothetical protein [Arsenicibacter rosenii]|uniref:Uncharacterized protein n=1 Tax=Arsenicibacter rosenii TaxID=1750698 RepID=A0A1S2VKI0_9BACT|nr:hypothetical protein [Arsenicibacter rosenii]OIN59243.1 hypothetical protein BLX24_09645 [Arsenicibacter rosenii]
MQSAQRHIQQWIKLISHLAVALCCLLLPTRSAGSRPLVQKQAFISYVKAEPVTSEPGNYPTLHKHPADALATVRISLPPLSSPDLAPHLIVPFFGTPAFSRIQQPHRSYFLFCFLRSVFEHQIAINAP